MAAFVQHPWGGWYGDPLRDLMHVNDTYARLHLLLRGAARVETSRPRWLILASRMRDPLALADLATWRPGAGFGDGAVEEFADESALFRAAAGRVPSPDERPIEW